MNKSEASDLIFLLFWALGVMCIAWGIGSGNWWPLGIWIILLVIIVSFFIWVGRNDFGSSL